MITNYLPEFKVFEVNNLVGLRSGHMLSQIPADSGIKVVTKGNTKFIENGIIVGLSKNGTVENFDADKHGVMFVHFTEELNTLIDELKYFAVPVEKTDAGVDDFASTYPRCIALYIGDTFTTNNIANINLEDAAYAKIVDGVITLQTAADSDTAFIATKTTLPDGSVAYEFLFYKLPGSGADASSEG